MKISLIAALSKNHVIGKNNQLPWRLPADLKHFKNITMGKIIIMGRKTYDSLGKALPNRTNVVISRNASLNLTDALVFQSLEQALENFQNEDEIFIIGGAELFKQALPLATHLYLTWVNADIEGDVYFPPFDIANWIESDRESHHIDDQHAYAYDFVGYIKVLHRIKKE
jgi:dihydrofolate reductase